ncbi:MAG TPA: 30S ribosomal protein S21 [Bryobacteraceae bacterium]
MTGQKNKLTHYRFSAEPAIMVRDVYTKGGELLVAEVHVQDGETLESALRRFKRKVQQEDIIKEIKRHSFYLKPGEKKRTKEALARKRNRKKRNKEVE